MPAFENVRRSAQPQSSLGWLFVADQAALFQNRQNVRLEVHRQRALRSG